MNNSVMKRNLQDCDDLELSDGILVKCNTTEEMVYY